MPSKLCNWGSEIPVRGIFVFWAFRILLLPWLPYLHDISVALWKRLYKIEFFLAFCLSAHFEPRDLVNASARWKAELGSTQAR